MEFACRFVPAASTPVRDADVLACVLQVPLNALDPNKAISQFTHTSWSAKDGIPGPVVVIAQTAEGYLWFGTHAGLYRFDGQNFVSWEPTRAGDRLPRSSITALLAARDGSLWIGFRSSAVSRFRSSVLKLTHPSTACTQEGSSHSPRTGMAPSGRAAHPVLAAS